ncbi:hypothetical protein B0H12DRAFT_1326729 [Mycena haematopus]|nr:hypothetical protein B0H12DRAFT_1326729 [Mycena haematopus]
MTDFFSAVGDGPDSLNLPDNTKLFAEAISARFNAQADDSILTARLLPPVQPMAIPREPSFDGQYTAVPPAALSQWLDDPRTLVLDIRPHAAYSSARIGRAVSLSVPSTLLKRPAFSLQRLSAMLPSASARARFSAWRTAPRILVYDADSTALSDTCNLQGLLRKFRADSPTVALAWLQGGFQAVWQARRDLVDLVPPTPETETEDDPDIDDDDRILRAHHLPRAAFALTSTTQAPRRAAPPLLNPAQFPNAHHNMAPAHPGKDAPSASYNPFYDAVRQNTELSGGITERIPLRLPKRVRRRVHELPFQWLRDIARRAAPVTPPDTNVNQSTATTSYGGPFATFRGRPDSSEDENESSDSGASVASWSAPSSYPPTPLSSPQYAAHQAEIDEGTEALAMQFYRIELAEQKRMMNVMDHHSRESKVVSRSSCNVSTPVPAGRAGVDGEGNADFAKGDKSAVDTTRDGGVTSEFDSKSASTDSIFSSSASGSGTSETDATSVSESSATGSSLGGERRRRGVGFSRQAGLSTSASASLSTSASASLSTSASASLSTSASASLSTSASASLSTCASGSSASAPGGPGVSEAGRRKGKSKKDGRFPFSITAGVEKGSKNRYRNIWPFEHARVRLHRLRARAATVPIPLLAAPWLGETEKAQLDPPAGQGSVAPPPPQLSRGDSGEMADVDADSAPEDDAEPESETEDEEYDNYINASYVQPLGTRRRYIATQGPLEATFGDFWTLVWQQNVHVIVMLTREVEGAMIKCGTYWRPGTYGPLRVELLGCAAEGCTSVCALCSTEAGAEPGGAGFFTMSGQMQSPRAPMSPSQQHASSPHANSPFSGHTSSPHNSSPLRQPPTPPTAPPGQLIKRTLRLTHAAYPDAAPRRIVQLHYLGWPDMNVPEDARGVLGLVWEVGKVVEEVRRGAVCGVNMEEDQAREKEKDEEPDSAGSSDDSEMDGATGVLRRALRAGDADAPVLLHCSAGVGRTGGFIAVDAVLDAVRQEAREMYAMSLGGDAGSGSSAAGGGSGASGASAGGSGSGEGIIKISAGIRAWGIREGEGGEEDRRMDVDVQVEVEGAVDVQEGEDAALQEGRTPMQVDSVDGGMALGDETTRRWAERTAFPTSSIASETGTGVGPASLPLGSPFQFQPPATHRTAFSLNLPRAHDSLPSTPDTDPHAQSKSASLPLKIPAARPNALPLAVRRGYADRMRTISAPSAAVPPVPPAPASTGSAPWLVPPKPSSNSPLPGKVLSDRPLANSPLPERPLVNSPLANSPLPDRPLANSSLPDRPLARSSLPDRPFTNSPLANSPLPDRPLAHSSLPDQPRSLSPFSAAGPSLRSIHSVGGSGGPNPPSQQALHVDYKEPRALHGRGAARPVRLSAFEDPIWEVVQDMREQRMSLCQSFRQYVFVHAAIIEGALLVVDEERARAGMTWRPSVHASTSRRGGLGARGRPTLFLMSSDETKSTPSSTGKRLASPTELPKEDKKGEIALSKRPSIKRKQPSVNEYTHPLATYPPM